MLLNSYEGFDYMDYSRYSMSTKDWGIVFIKSMAATVIIAYLFYDSPIAVSDTHLDVYKRQAGSSNLQIDISDIGNMAVQIGANEGQEMKIRIPEVSSQTLYLDTVDVTVKGGADKAMSTLDEAIEYVSGVRSRIGAFQNRLESAESSLSETSENMTGAYSNIMDTDMATEMTEYAAQNILDQAGISVLSQANDLPQQVLSLLSR